MRTTRYVLGLDLGGATRNGICMMDSNDRSIVEYSYIPFEKGETKLDHRNKIIKKISECINHIDDNSNVSIVFERINLYRGGAISHLYNIISLCRVQTTIINEFSDVCPIYDIAVKSWKSRELGDGNATKEDSIRVVSKLYPNVDLNAVVKHSRKPDEIVPNHDLADSILIARSCCSDPLLLDDKNKLNYK